MVLRKDSSLAIWVMIRAAASREFHDAIYKPTRFTLNSDERVSIFNNEVVTLILTEGEQDHLVNIEESGQNLRRCSVADEFGVYGTFRVRHDRLHFRRRGKVRREA